MSASWRYILGVFTLCDKDWADGACRELARRKRCLVPEASRIRVGARMGGSRVNRTLLPEVCLPEFCLRVEVLGRPWVLFPKNITLFVL